MYTVVCLGRTAAASNRLLCKLASQHESCLCGCESRMSKQRKKKIFYSTSESGHRMLLTSYPLGAFQQHVVHHFSGRVEVLQLLSLTLTSLFLPDTFPLSCSCLALSLSPYCSFFLLWRDPSATLMKRQVLCDSVSPVGVTRWRDDGSGAGQ